MSTKGKSEPAEKRFPHYWLCHKCATEMGGVHPGGVGTAVLKQCQYCHGKNHRDGEALLPWVDYNWPNDRRAQNVAEQARD